MGSKSNNTIIIGITGSFGTGKTTAAKVFKALGAVVLDADSMAHEALKKNTTSYKEVVKVFGRSILDGDGRINRAKLAGLAFHNKRNLRKLCDIIHPIVVKKIKRSVIAISNSGNVPAVVIDAPLLIEAGLHEITDYLIVVKTSRATQVKRAMKKTHLSSNEVMKRIRNQISLSKKVRMADYIIDNEGSKNSMKKTIKKIWEGIKSGGN